MCKAHSQAVQVRLLAFPPLYSSGREAVLRTGGVGSLAGAGQLTELDLSNNKLTGALPALPAAIQMANMSGNAFAGGIPTSYGVLLLEQPPQHAPETCRATAEWACMWLGCGCSSCLTACLG